MENVKLMRFSYEGGNEYVAIGKRTAVQVFVSFTNREENWMALHFATDIKGHEHDPNYEPRCNWLDVPCRHYTVVIYPIDMKRIEEDPEGYVSDVIMDIEA
jgi:hypothetical protein